MVVLASSKTPEARFMAWQKLRGQGGWPRHMLLSDGDNELPFDLENTMSLDALWGVIKSWKDAVLLEDFPGTESRAIHGPEGAYAGQLMLPYLASMEAEPTLHSPILEGDPVRYGPGSDWLFVKLYTGRASADQILAGPLNELVKEVIASKEVDRWFFIRYSDPEPHLRVRFHGDAYTLCHAVLPRVHRLLDPLAQDGWFSGIQLDSYEPELSRYGGFNNLETIEAIFHADSEAVLKILAVIPADEGPLDTRWPLGLISVDQWLAAAGLALSERLTFVRNLHAGFSSPPGLEQASLKKHLGKRFREERTRLESLFSGASSLPRTWAMGREILLERTRQTTPMFDAMRRLLEVGDLTLSLEEVLGSIVHMGLNRLLRATNSQQEEPVIHYFLGQLYASQLARGGMLPRP
jgi:thiopeptide-type bacteriocin biosynthesis protein